MPGVFLALLCLPSKAQDISRIGQEKPFAVSGYLDLKGIFYNVSGIEPRRKPFSYFINGAPVFSFYGITIPVSFTLSEQERSFRQPFNQFGLSPYYKWLTVHLGYRNIQFSPYTLAGYTMLGAGVEMHPGLFRFGFMYGRLNRATKLDTTLGVVQPYSFSRRGMAMKIGVGNENHYVDFSFLKAKDDTNSLKSKINPGDTLPVMAAANFVAGVSTHLKMGSKIFFDADAAYSIYTRNIQSQLALPEDLEKLERVAGSIMPINATSEKYMAYSAGLTFKDKYFSLKLGYKRVDPNFQSMGAYFFNNDLQNITIAPSFYTKNNKFRFSGSIGFQKDNLQKQKVATTKRVIGSANMSWNIDQHWGIDANYMNFSANSTPEVVSVNNKYLLAHTTNNISVNPRYILTKNNLTHVALLSYNYSVLSDANQDTKAWNTVKTNVVFMNYNITVLQSALTLMAGANYTTNELSIGTTKYYGFSIGASKNVAKNKITLGTNNSYSLGSNDNSPNVLNASVTASYRPAAKHQFNLRWVMVKTTYGSASTAPSFNENTGEVGYTLSF